MADPETSRDVNAKQAVECIRGSMSNREIMELFQISSKGYADLLKQLLQRRLITRDDLTRRGIVLKKTKKQQKPKQPPPIAPEPDEDDTAFLDTVTLTEMLSQKMTPSSVEEQAESEEVPVPVDEDVEVEEEKDRKSRITGFFRRKGR